MTSPSRTPRGLERPPDPFGYAWQLAAALGWSSLGWLHRVSVRTLVLGAERDRMVHPSTARLLARRLPEARLHVVPGAGHFFLLREDDETTARVIEAFLDDGPADGQGVEASPAALACT